MSATRPPYVEQERRKLIEEMSEVAGDSFRYRIKNAEILADIQAQLKYGDLWMQNHDRQDTEKFNEIFKRLGVVSSGVNDYNDTKTQLKGMRNLIIGVVAVLSTIGGAVFGVIELAKYFGKAP